MPRAPTFFFFFFPERKWRGAGGGNACDGAAASLAIGHLLSSGGEPWPGFPCVSLEQTQMLQEEMLSQKGLLGVKSVKVMGLLLGMLVLCFSLGCLQSPFINSFLSPLCFPWIYIHFVKTSNPHVYSILLKFDGEEEKGRKKAELGRCRVTTTVLKV